MAKTKTSRSAGKPAPVTAAASVDAQLARYRDMRDFSVTAEPAGGAKRKHAAGLPFVIQKHAASHLHYDFRLGWNGVLKSWACARGPSYNVRDRRLAVQVEDHPMEYGGFEGVIPKGQYGGGTVMVWDQGTWEPQQGHADIDAGLRDGQIKFLMHGTRMHGKWALIRMHDKPAGEGRWRSSGKPNWLLIKEHDEFERAPDAAAITEQATRSVVTQRTLEQIAASEDHTWNSRKTAGPGQAWTRNAGPAKAPAPVTAKSAKTAKPRKSGAAAKGSTDARLAIDKLPTETQPPFVKPQLAQEAADPPEGAGWLHELKLDGYRIQARKACNDVKLMTRSGLDWTHRVPALAAAIARLPQQAITLDGEAVVLREDGTTNFADLQASFQDGARHPLTYFAFDLLHLDGHDTRALPLLQRKQLLADVLQGADGDELRFSEHLTVDGRTMFRKACEFHAEGIVSKRADAPYRSTRSADWLKSKCLHEQEFVIGGYTLASGSATRIGSLLLGYYEEERLVLAGRTGTGFTQISRIALLKQLGKLTQKTPAFAPMSAAARKDAVWVKPVLVAQVRFATWTAGNMVRQAAFLGLREDKPAQEVHRESTHSAPAPKSHAPRKPIAPAPKPVHRGSAAALATPLPASVRLTHPGKVLDAETGVTKQQLAEYYWRVAPLMLPYVAARPLSLVRCPDGAAKPCFYQKHVNHLLPAGVAAVLVPDQSGGKDEPYITLDSAEALAGLAQMGCLEVHGWGSANADLEHPDRLVFDLDPDETLPWTRVTAAAEDVRSRLKAAGLNSFVKTTGGKGLHVVAPIVPALAWPEIKLLAHRFVTAMERAEPRLYLTKMTKAARIGRIYLDYLRNERGATSVATYSPRARPGLPVSMPLGWPELRGATRPEFRVADLTAWQSRLKKNPWRNFDHTQGDARALS